MKKFLIIVVIVAICLLSSCSKQKEFRIPQNLSSSILAMQPAELYDLITMEKVDEILGSKVSDGVAALYQDGGKSVVVYVGCFSSTIKGRMFFEGMALKSVFSIKNYSESMSGGMLEIEKRMEKVYILWDRFYAIIIRGDKELSKDIYETYIRLFSSY